MSLAKRGLAELIGTFWLVLGGCGSAVLAAGIPELGLGYLGVSFAFGLTVVTMAYAIGHISGCHLNPAVSIGLVAGGRFKAAELPHYIVAQVVGAILAATVIYLIASGKAGFEIGGFAANGYGEASPHGYNLQAALIERFNLAVVSLRKVNGSQVVQADGHAGMVRRKRLLFDRQGPLKKPLGLRVISQCLIHRGQIVQATGHLAMIRPQELFVQRQGLKVE